MLDNHAQLYHPVNQDFDIPGYIPKLSINEGKRQPRDGMYELIGGENETALALWV